MSETKIKPGKSTAVEAEIVPDETAIAVVNGGGQVSLRKTVRNELVLGTGVHGLPINPCYMDIAYSVSPWNDKDFSDGSFVLDRETQIYKAGQDPLAVVLLTHSRYFAEWRTGVGKTGELQKYDTAEQAKAAGEILPSDERGGPLPTVGVAYDLWMLVRKPADVECDKFVFKLDGQWYAYVKLSLVKGLGRDADKALVNLCSWEAGVRGVRPGEGQCNRYLLDIGLNRVKKDSKTYTNLMLRYHTKDRQPEVVSGDLIRDVLSLREMSETAAPAEAEDCPL
jgi:hypothetical protein